MTHLNPEIFETPNTPENAKLLNWLFECHTTGCRWRTAHRTQAIAERERERHRSVSCPYVPTLKDESVTAGKQVIERMWDKLDVATARILDHKGGKQPLDEYQLDDHQLTLEQGRAQGIAACILIMSHPFFEDTSAIARWAVKRYKMAAGEIEVMPTPGINGYNPTVIISPTTPVKQPARGGTPRKRTQAAVKPVPQSDIETLEGGIEAGFTDEALLRVVKTATPELLAELRQRVKPLR